MIVIVHGFGKKRVSPGPRGSSARSELEWFVTRTTRDRCDNSPTENVYLRVNGSLVHLPGFNVGGISLRSVPVLFLLSPFP